MILTEEETEEIENRPFSQNDWLWFYTRAIEQAIFDKLQDKLKNSDRYEWLRDENNTWDIYHMIEDGFHSDKLDKAIDSAMKVNTCSIYDTEKDYAHY